MAPHETARPLTAEDFAARCAALKIGRRWALAVSGGRDSMALVRLAAEYAKRTGVEVRAFTVDHGLREASAQEAPQTAAWCRAIGVGHETLVWRGPKPVSGVQAAARAARYRLLAEAAATMKADCLMTAHSADDRAETLFMRLARGAGSRGLAAIEDEVFIAAGAAPPLRLLRPLLCFSRDRLTATARAYNQPFIDDPSNDDPAYERIRVRALLAALEQNGLLTRAALNRTAGRMRAANRRLRRAEEQAFISLGGCFYRWGAASLDHETVKSYSDDMGGLSRRLVYAVSGEPHAPDEDAARDALAAVLNTGAATLGGALIRRWNGRVWFLREPAAVLGRAGVAPLASLNLGAGEPSLWDGRFTIAVHTGDGLTVKPLGAAPSEPADPRLGAFSGPPEGLATQPGVFRSAALIAAPAVPSMATARVSFRPLAAERFAGATIRFSQA